MAINTIGYDNKVALNENPSVADINKVKAEDMNEIKTVVNANANGVGDISTLNTTATNAVGAINEVNNKVPVYEYGYVASSNMTAQSIGGTNGRIYDLTFTKTYTTPPAVMATACHNRGLTSYGLILVGVRGITTTGCSLLFNNNMSDDNYGINYLVIGN